MTAQHKRSKPAKAVNLAEVMVAMVSTTIAALCFLVLPEKEITEI